MPFRIKAARRPTPQINATASAANSAKPKKYHIWSEGLQEECLTENLKVCGVDRESSNYDRNVESYDFKLKYRLNGENRMKRRQSSANNSEDEDESTEKRFNCFANGHRSNKRFRMDCDGGDGGARVHVRHRLGQRSNNDDSSSNDSAGNQLHARAILDLNIKGDSSNCDVARELANKLYEEKDDLLRKIDLIIIIIIYIDASFILECSSGG